MTREDFDWRYEEVMEHLSYLTDVSNNLEKEKLEKAEDLIIEVWHSLRKRIPSVWVEKK